MSSSSFANAGLQTADPLSFETASQYNPVDQLSEVVDANLGSTKLTYDARRNLASVINPLNVPIESYQYDAQNRLTQRTDAKGKSTGYKHSGVRRIRSLFVRINVSISIHKLPCSPRQI